MNDEGLSSSEAMDLGVRLEALSAELSPGQREFLRRALGIAAADLWARAGESVGGRSVLDLVVDIHAAGAADSISLNPLPIPVQSKGQLT